MWEAMHMEEAMGYFDKLLANDNLGKKLIADTLNNHPFGSTIQIRPVFAYSGLVPMDDEFAPESELVDVQLASIAGCIMQGKQVGITTYPAFIFADPNKDPSHVFIAVGFARPIPGSKYDKYLQESRRMMHPDDLSSVYQVVCIDGSGKFIIVGWIDVNTEDNTITYDMHGTGSFFIDA